MINDPFLIDKIIKQLENVSKDILDEVVTEVIEETKNTEVM